MKNKIYKTKTLKRLGQSAMKTVLILLTLMIYESKAQVTCLQLSCPQNVNVNAGPGQCSAIVNYNPPGVVDACCTLPTSLSGYNFLGTFGGHTYFMSTVTADWQSANAAANATGGKLVSVNSAAENAFLLSVTQGIYFLIGGFQNHSNPNYSEPSGGWE